MSYFINGFFLGVMLLLSSCSYVKRKLSSTGPRELPPTRISNVAEAKGDQTPVVKTEKGFVKAPIPGIPDHEQKVFEYKTFVGVSN